MIYFLNSMNSIDVSNIRKGLVTDFINSNLSFEINKFTIDLVSLCPSRSIIPCKISKNNKIALINPKDSEIREYLDSTDDRVYNIDDNSVILIDMTEIEFTKLYLLAKKEIQKRYPNGVDDILHYQTNINQIDYIIDSSVLQTSVLTDKPLKIIEVSIFPKILKEIMQDNLEDYIIINVVRNSSINYLLSSHNIQGYLTKKGEPILAVSNDKNPIDSVILSLLYAEEDGVFNVRFEDILLTNSFQINKIINTKPYERLKSSYFASGESELCNTNRVLFENHKELYLVDRLQSVTNKIYEPNLSSILVKKFKNEIIEEDIILPGSIINLDNVEIDKDNKVYRILNLTESKKIFISILSSYEKYADTIREVKEEYGSFSKYFNYPSIDLTKELR